MTSCSYKILSFMILMMTYGPSCGVNTGNPGSKLIGHPSIRKPGTSLTLNLLAVDGGKLNLHVKSVSFIPSGESLRSPLAVRTAFNATQSISSGQESIILSRAQLSSAIYDRVVLELESEEPASITGLDGLTKPIAVAPYRYYDPLSAQDAIESVALVLTLAQGKTLAIDQKKAMLLTFDLDLSSNLTNTAGMKSGARDYFVSQGKLESFAYSLSPDATPEVTEREIEAPPTGISTETETETVPPLAIPFIEFTLILADQKMPPPKELLVCVFHSSKPSTTASSNPCDEAIIITYVQLESNNTNSSSYYFFTGLKETGYYRLEVLSSAKQGGTMQTIYSSEITVDKQGYSAIEKIQGY